jgi:hypothetical protein
MTPGTTGIIMARFSSVETLADSIGNVWTRDQCTNFTGDCAFSTRFNIPYPMGDTITFPPGEGTDAYLLIYDGTWNFDSGSTGDYSISNSAFPSDCTNGQDCPYSWTPPLDAVPGALLIAWADANSTGKGIASPGFGFNIEASDGTFAVEDMIAPLKSVYIGSLEWKNADGSDSGGSHWLMGFAEYRCQ